MSYCRWSDGELYVTSGPPLICWKCSLHNGEEFEGTKIEMLQHLKKHRDAGHCFPFDAIYRLEAEVEEEALTGKPSSFYLRCLPKRMGT